MARPAEGNYLFIHYGYGDDHQPELQFLADGDRAFTYLHPHREKLTLHFDMSKRFCSGWHDLASAESFPCPDAAELPDQYDQCRHCQRKTGFNPAFYNASSVSEQQQVRNAQPHLLYLAHFGPDVVKVGISWAQRGIKRLLDQGARSGLIVKTYPNADIARQYEAKIAKLPGIVETLQLRQKYQLLKHAYDEVHAASELRTARDRLIQEAGVAPDDNDPLHLDPFYLGDYALQPHHLVDVTKNNSISGTCIGVIGSILITEQEGLQYTLPLSKLTGYRCTMNYMATSNHTPPHQMSFF